MAKVQKTVITALGEQMLFSSALTYTDATLCSQDVSNLTTDQLRALTDLTGKVLSSPISAHKRQGNTKADQVDVQVTFTNRDQKTDINYSSIGWFARDRQGHETLIAVTPFFGTDTIAAAPPDGTATSSKNITLSMAVGTATEINVLIDPAGSVTPSTFNAEIDKINKALALKADNAELADYAKTADVQAKLDTKANTTDLAPFAKSTDVDKQIENVNNAVTNATNTEQANIDKISKALATKRDITDSYSKDELDKKFLQLSTDTGGKVDANKVATMIENKADKSGVNTALRGKANVGDVTVLQGKVNVSTPLFREISDDSTWEDIFGVTNPTNVLTSLRINPGGNGQLVNDYAAGIGFGGNDTKAVISVDYDSHVARFTAGNGISPGWSEDVAWKSDISSLTQALTKLQAAFDAQQTKIAALQATVNNQANQLTYFKQHYIEGKAFDADQIKQAMAWTGDDGQKLAIIRDKENEGGK